MLSFRLSRQSSHLTRASFRSCGRPLPRFGGFEAAPRRSERGDRRSVLPATSQVRKTHEKLFRDDKTFAASRLTGNKHSAAWRDSSAMNQRAETVSLCFNTAPVAVLSRVWRIHWNNPRVPPSAFWVVLVGCAAPCLCSGSFVGGARKLHLLCVEE